MAHNYIYGIHMNINLRCCRCLHVEPCDKCMKEIVVDDAMIEARRAAEAEPA
jgi:hypothetical protein